MIMKQVIQLKLIMLVGTDVCVRMVFVWFENWFQENIVILHIVILIVYLNIPAGKLCLFYIAVCHIIHVFCLFQLIWSC